jgi:hypothetical protein
MKLKRTFRTVLITMTGFFLIAQAYRPALDHPPVTGDFDGPAEGKSIFQKSCFPCHSNETKLPWYDQINPAYLIVRNNVLEARQCLNFSHWDSLNPAQRRIKMFDAMSVMKTFNRMPKKDYVLVHHGAALSATDLTTLESYIEGLVTPVNIDSNASIKQMTVYRLAEVKPAPNGPVFMPEYKDGQVVSVTDRYDNRTTRHVLANSVAALAIREGRNNPYPDGASLA